jgi:NADPH2:quinone reductase
MTGETMRTIVVEGGKGPVEAMRLVEVPRPVPAEGQILIRIRAAGLNRADLLQREGGYPPPPGAPDTMGLECAGEVVTPAGRWKAGDRVCALLGGGGYAEYVAVDARHALPIPDGMDFVHAAALPETVLTVWANVFEPGALKAGETLLVHGAGSGIGTTAIQMGKAAGARVIATARGPVKTAAAKALGADEAIDASAEDFAVAVRKLGGCDVVLEMIGADYFPMSLDALNYRGRIVYIAAQAGAQVTLNINKMMMKQAVITGSTLRGRAADEKARLTAAVEATAWPWVAAGKVKPQVHSTSPLAEAAKAHATLASGEVIGKVILTA